MHDRSHAVYVISVAAELAGVHPQTLRIYERKGLLEPARTGGGSRRYSQADIELLRRIQDLTNEGLNLAGVQRVLELEQALVQHKRTIAQLQDDLRQVQRQSIKAVEDAHRSHRRDLVPLRQEVVLYSERRPRQP